LWAGRNESTGALLGLIGLFAADRQRQAGSGRILSVVGLVVGFLVAKD
jgi:hypothetical protein